MNAQRTTIEELTVTFAETAAILAAAEVIMFVAPRLPAQVRMQALDAALSSTEGLFTIAAQLAPYIS